MGRPSSLSKALSEIRTWFDDQESSFWSETRLREVFNTHRESWSLAKRTEYNQFRTFLYDNRVLHREEIKFPSKSEVVIYKGNPTTFEKISSVTNSSYLSHITALFIHELTEQIPRHLYVTTPQKASSKNIKLTQDQILESSSKAFKRSLNSIVYEEMLATALFGIKIDGVRQKMNHTFFGSVYVSSLEKTLIDIAVRPEYSGGIDEVLNAYREAAGKFQPNDLARLLRKHKFLYPYHQTVGYYMEKSQAYKKMDLRIMSQPGITHKFMLVKGLSKEDCVYNERWKLYVPRGFET